ncbi:MAG TPA: ribose 5-phosphate isomerase B [Bacteroidota bacterium]|nr:ribose 5-phosphate isomerase B [Bacteroidota bacterium]
MAKTVLTERDIVNASKAGKVTVFADGNTVITPSARDKARELNIVFTSEKADTSASQPAVKGGEAPAGPVSQTKVERRLVVVGSDHGGYGSKEELKKYLGELGYEVLDVGTNSAEACDYPEFAYAVARIVAKGEAWRGIMIDATGVASAIVCNKVPGIRAAACYNEVVAASSREHNDANVLTLGAKVLGSELQKSIVRVWLETWFGGGRHKKRVDKISDVERRFSR